MTKIVVIDGYTLNPGDNPWDELAKLGQLKVYDRSDPAELVERASDVDILVVNKFRLGQKELDSLPKLKMIAVTATGYDCVDVQAARERQVPVANVPVYGTNSVAQYVFAMLLHICHRIDIHDAAIRNGEWEQAGDFSFWRVPLVELVGKRMGIIGFGRIGRRVGRLANAFGMQVLACSNRHVDTPSYDPFQWVDRDTLAQKSDVISLNCPLTDETKGLVNRDFLSKCSSQTILLNASRGPLIVEQDLADALNSNHIAASGLDVACQEPISSESPLLNAKNCFLTPHLAWATLAARRRLLDTTVSNIACFLDGKSENVVNA